MQSGSARRATAAFAVTLAAVIWLSPAALAVERPNASPPAHDSATDSPVFQGPSESCRAWTDGCRICSRAQDGKVACSNIGIACQPGKLVCTQDDPSRQGEMTTKVRLAARR
jgi:hypothetical protein